MRRPVGLTLLTAFFVFGALMAFLAFLGLLLSGGFLEPIWRLNPDAHRALTELGAWGMLLMAAVASACTPLEQRLCRTDRRVRGHTAGGGACEDCNRLTDP